MPWLEDAVQDGPGAARGALAGFRSGLYRCLTGRGDALFELADAVLCGQGRVHMLAELLRDLPVEVLGRLRSDRVMYFPAPAREPGANRRPARHGAALRLPDPGTWPAPAAATVTTTARYGTITAQAWGRLHQRLGSRAGWEDHHGGLPVIEGTLIRLHVTDRLRRG
jgi:hypothetical protein